MAWTDVASAISSVVVGGSAVVCAWAACSGVSAWKRELRGKAKYELARRLLCTVYRVRDRVKAFRAAFDDITVDSVDEQKLFELLNKQRCVLDTLLLEAEVIWGNRLTRAKGLMDDLLADLRRAFGTVQRMSRHSALPKASEEKLEEAREKLRPREEGKPDDLRDKLTNAFAEFGAALRQVFGSRSAPSGTMCSFVKR